MFNAVCTAFLLFSLLFNFSGITLIKAETLQSDNFTIEDADINTGGEVLSSDTYNMLTSLGDINSDARLVSGTYAMESGFPNGVHANVPSIRCFETTSTTDNSSCTELPLAKGMQGECGAPGCYNKAKIEINSEGNPVDTLYLVKLIDTTDNSVYFLQSDHTPGTSYDASDLMTICQIAGRDDNDSSCNDDKDNIWNKDMQSADIFGLNPNTSYLASVEAVNGDFTGSGFSATSSAKTSNTSITFDLDIAPVSNPETDSSAPYEISLNQLAFKYPTTAANLIWFDIGSNISEGVGVYIRDTEGGLHSASKDVTIPSESEDLATDPNNNGGFGLKIYNYSLSQSSLGPLQYAAAYNTSGDNVVGQVSTTNQLLFFTNNSNDNKGQIFKGRGAVYIEARSAYSTPIAGDYSTQLITTIVGNY